MYHRLHRFYVSVSLDIYNQCPSHRSQIHTFCPKGYYFYIPDAQTNHTTQNSPCHHITQWHRTIYKVLYLIHSRGASFAAKGCTSHSFCWQCVDLAHTEYHGLGWGVIMFIHLPQSWSGRGGKHVTLQEGTTTGFQTATSLMLCSWNCITVNALYNREQTRPNVNCRSLTWPWYTVCNQWQQTWQTHTYLWALSISLSYLYFICIISQFGVRHLHGRRHIRTWTHTPSHENPDCLSHMHTFQQGVVGSTLPLLPASRSASGSGS